MKVAVVGPGAMGLFLAASLFQAGQDVLLLDYKTERAELVSREGVSVEGRWKGLPIPITADPAEAAEADLILFCVKAYQTEKAALTLNGFPSSRARVLTLQNGVGNLETLIKAFGPERVGGGVTSEGATLLGPGRVRHAGRGETTLAAVQPEEEDGLLARTAAVFNQAGLKTKVEKDVWSLVWSKLIVNIGINALTAVTRLHNGRLLEHPGAEKIMALAVAEATAAASALGVKLLYPDPLDRVRQVAQGTAGNVSSMLQDILAQRPTEIDFINGAVAERARELGLAAPVNETLAGLVRTIESSYHQAFK